MEWIALRQNAWKHLGKYKYALLILAVGLFLMSFPVKGRIQPEAEPSPVPVQEDSLEQRLSDILCQIEGVGETKVLLTESCGPESVFQMDGNNDRSETVIISDGNRAETGLVKRVLSPVYQGAIVVCQGGGSASVRLSVMEAVANVTGISANRITVLKMN